MKTTLPPNWSWVKLGDVVENFKRGPFGSAIKKSFFVPEGYKVYEQKNAIYNSIELGNYFINEEKFLELKGFEIGPGDFIVSCSGTIGKIYRLPQNSPRGIINQALLRIRLKEKRIFEKYFLELFKSYGFQKKMLVETRGSAMLNIAGVKELKQIPIPLPPLPEQKKIVEKIEELFSGLDSGVALLKKAKEQIRLYRQSVLASAFSGKLVREIGGRQSAVGKIEILKAAEPKVEYSSSHPEFISGSEKLKQVQLDGISNQLPDGWKWVKLGDVLEVKDGTHDTPKYHDKGIPFITQKNIKNGEFVFDNYNLISEEDHQKFYKRSNVAFNDIIISMIGANRGMSTIVKTKETFSIKNVGLVKTDESKFLAKYLAYFFKSEIGQSSILSQSKGGAQQFIGLTELRNWSIPFQPLNHQTQIVEEIEKRFSEADNLEKAIDDSLVKSETLRQSILKQAFEGKLV